MHRWIFGFCLVGVGCIGSTSTGGGSGSTSAGGPAAGNLGGPCWSGGSCRPALVCAGEVCRSPDEFAEGSEFGRCYPNNSCNTGLDCVAGLCRLRERGTLGGACYANGTCNDGFRCGPSSVCETAPSTELASCCDCLGNRGHLERPTATQAECERAALDGDPETRVTLSDVCLGYYECELPCSFALGQPSICGVPEDCCARLAANTYVYITGTRPCLNTTSQTACVTLLRTGEPAPTDYTTDNTNTCMGDRCLNSCAGFPPRPRS